VLSADSLPVRVDPILVDVAAGLLSGSSDSRGSAWGDYDGDGDLDIFVSNNGTNRLFRNEGGFSFSEVGMGVLNDSGIGGSSAWADYDNDGDLDLAFSGNELILARNDVTTFSLVSIPALNQVQTVSWVDVDSDGDLDLYLAATNVAGAESRLLLNNGAGGFVRDTSNPIAAGWAQAVAWGDYDNDGDPDLYLVHGTSANDLYRNDGAGT